MKAISIDSYKIKNKRNWKILKKRKQNQKEKYGDFKENKKKVKNT